MKTFTGWRAVGRAMRWARQQHGVTYDRTLMIGNYHYDRPPSLHVDHRWRDNDHREVMVSHSSILSTVDVRIGNGVNEWDTTYNDDTRQVLRVLAALDLIPADLAEVADE